ncbi:uncharacterized protein METZ01_LOCUS251977 [marine metagenome]|uniref:Uncharacterized protein n=1 Tax=marine metagenome TaxID=408172 RepID=A0A382IJT8_9ZZZZ
MGEIESIKSHHATQCRKLLMFLFKETIENNL